MRKLLSVPPGTCSQICSQELGLDPLSEIIKSAPALLWLKVWTKKEAILNRDILADCLSLDYGCKIPWIAKTKTFFKELGREDLFFTPESVRCR